MTLVIQPIFIRVEKHYGADFSASNASHICLFPLPKMNYPHVLSSIMFSA